MYFTKYTKNILINHAILKNYRGCFYNTLSDEIPDVSLTTIKRILKNYNIQFEEGHTCLITNCPICSKLLKVPNNPSKSNVYINKTTGFFSCYKCNYFGSWNLFQKLFASKEDKSNILKQLFKYEFTKDSQSYKSVISSTKQINKCSDETVLNICKKLGLPNASINVLNLLNVRVDDLKDSLYVPLTNVEGNISGFRIFETNQERTIPTNGCSGIIVGRATKSRDTTATIVPTLNDALTLLENRISGNIICLPYGLNTLPLTVLPTLERFMKLVLWFGNDVNSWDTARSFAKKLGEKRCFFVRPTDKQPLPHVAVAQGIDLKSILNGAQSVWHKSITTFSSLRNDVLCDLQNIDRVQGVKWKRFPTLNRILKGHRRGELTVITGPTGCGKTTFISEYSLDLAMQGVNTLWGSFEIRNARLARTMLQQMAGCALDEHLDKFDEYADEFEKLPVYFMTFHGQQSIKIVMEAVEHATYVHDISHVIIDNVQFMMGMSESETRHMDRFWKQDAIVAAFRMFATRRNCHVTLVIHPRKERESEELTTSSIFGGAKASQEADNVLIIQDKRLSSVRGKKYLQVAKNRYSGDLGVMPMEFDKGALSYTGKKKKVTDSNLHEECQTLQA